MARYGGADKCILNYGQEYTRSDKDSSATDGIRHFYFNPIFGR